MENFVAREYIKEEGKVEHMPGFTTHYLFGVKNVKQLKNKDECQMLCQSIDNYRTVFQLGLQGPDIFFYHPASQLKRIRPGSIVHTRSTGDFLRCLMEAPELFWKESEKQAAQAYAAGFIGHYLLDTQMHPYVYCITGVGDELEKKGYADHIGLESDIDACLLMRYKKCLPSRFPYGRTIMFDSDTRQVIATVLYYAYNVVFPELSLSKSFLARAVHSMQFGTMLTYNPHNYKRQVVSKVENFIMGHPVISTVIPTDHLRCYEDPLNLQHKQWHNPWNTSMCSTDSVPQMIKKASGKYQKALKYLDYLYQAEQFEEDYDNRLEDLCRFLGQKSFHSGLDWILGEEINSSI